MYYIVGYWYILFNCSPHYAFLTFVFPSLSELIALALILALIIRVSLLTPLNATQISSGLDKCF